MMLFIAATALLYLVRFYDLAFQHRGFYLLVVAILAYVLLVRLYRQAYYLKKNYIDFTF